MVQRMIVFLVLICGSVQLTAENRVTVAIPEVALRNVPVEISVSGATPGGTVFLAFADLHIESASNLLGEASFNVVFPDAGQFTVGVFETGAEPTTVLLRVVPGWVSILPPAIAIFIALLLRSVLPALMIGIWLGATALVAFSPMGMFTGLLDSVQRFVVDALADRDHASIIVFTMLIGGMVGIITHNGGMSRVIDLVIARARTPRAGQISVWLMGIAIFFDDYSNTLVVGNTARPITDRLHISREKLAYLVDSTAAPVASLALVTTWIGYEVGLIDTALESIAVDESAYSMFLQSIPYSFYPVLAVLFVLTVAASGRDFGPMLVAEQLARHRGRSRGPADAGKTAAEGLLVKRGVPHRAVNAVVPLLVLITTLIASLYLTGEGDSLTDIIGSANAYQAMLWASFMGVIAAAALTLSQRILTAAETVDAWFLGAREMLFAMIVLVLAWSLSGVTDALHTADYLVTLLADSLQAPLLPAAVFVLSALTAFATGTSWGTMGILMPLVIPLTWAIMGADGIQDADHMHILYSAIACNLAGAVWGDHCSPISDTTVLSSLASGCDHVEHVRTQLPYAGLVGIIAVAAGTIPAGYGAPPLLLMVVGMTLLVGILFFLGRSADTAAE